MGDHIDHNKQKMRPQSFVVEPAAPHTRSFILLHGLGSNGEKFGKELLEKGICSDGRTLTQAFPGTRFIFPTSKRRRSNAFGRAMLTQWFNIASLDDPSYRNHTQIQGLEESFHEIMALVHEESAKVTPGNVVIGGLSQGCAMSLICLLALEFSVGGFVGMSGWLPFREAIEEQVAATEDDSQGEDVFDFNAERQEAGPDIPEHEATHPMTRVIDYIRDLLSLSNTENASLGKSAIRTPIFLGHGEADDKIKPLLGEDAKKTLNSIGFRVSWRSYRDQGHWYKVPDEIDDVIEFLQKECSKSGCGLQDSKAGP